MSMLLMVQAMKTKVGNPLRKLVLIKLADNANDQGECWPSYQHIADQCEMGKSTVRKHIKDLADSGLLRVEHREGPKGNTSNLYHLTLHPMSPDSTPMPRDSTGGVSPDSTRTSHSFESTNNLSLVQKNSEPKKSKFKFNDDDIALAEWMFKRVLVINPTAKQPNMESWANTVRLMREVNKYTYKQIGETFDWANKDSFWCSNILSPDKLRKQWDKLNAKRLNNHAANQQGNAKPGRFEQSQSKLAEWAKQNGVDGMAMGVDDSNLRPEMDQGLRGSSDIDLDSSDWEAI